MWLPYCVILPLILRRNAGVPFYRDWWFKFQVWVGVFVFFATYFLAHPNLIPYGDLQSS